jgi:hypothetical protein
MLAEKHHERTAHPDAVEVAKQIQRKEREKESHGGLTGEGDADSCRTVS